MPVVALPCGTERSTRYEVHHRDAAYGDHWLIAATTENLEHARACYKAHQAPIGHKRIVAVTVVTTHSVTW